MHTHGSFDLLPLRQWSANVKVVKIEWVFFTFNTEMCCLPQCYEVEMIMYMHFFDHSTISNVIAILRHVLAYAQYKSDSLSQLLFLLLACKCNSISLQATCFQMLTFSPFHRPMSFREFLALYKIVTLHPEIKNIFLRISADEEELTARELYKFIQVRLCSYVFIP